MNQNEKRQCEGRVHYFDISDGKIAEVCRCPMKKKRKVMK